MDKSTEAVQQPVRPLLYDFQRKRLIEACEAAEHPKGMSTHDGYAKVLAHDIRRLLAIVDATPVAQPLNSTYEAEQLLRRLNDFREHGDGKQETWEGLWIEVRAHLNEKHAEPKGGGSLGTGLQAEANNAVTGAAHPQNAATINEAGGSASEPTGTATAEPDEGPEAATSRPPEETVSPASPTAAQRETEDVERRIFSGDDSRRLWRLINAVPAEAGDALYALGCALQEFENRCAAAIRGGE